MFSLFRFFLFLFNIDAATHSYVILQGLSGTASGFLQVVPLILYYVKLFILGSTPRSIYAIKYTGRNVAWGTLWPATTLLVVIGMCLSFVLFYFVLIVFKSYSPRLLYHLPDH